MVVPALIYAAVNWNAADALNGWAVPVATDIAFALGVLSLFGRRVPLGLKIFLMALAIFDDMGAIIIIAAFHSRSLSYWSFLFAFLLLVVLWLMNKNGVRRISPYIVVGFTLWVCVLNSGVHATVAGVLLAFFIPQRTQEGEDSAPAQRLENSLHAWVTFVIMPLFALANAGVSLQGLSKSILFDTIVVGIVLGLFIGKQLGVVFFTWLVVRFGWAKLPENTTWLEVYAVAILCGIGFTMSLFLGTLAFEGINPVYLVEVRLGVLCGSLLSGMTGAALLQMALTRKSQRNLEGVQI
jgi:NhaA family Na+:H+ antiporter